MSASKKVLKPTDQQQTIIDTFGDELDAPASSRKHIIVNALAGTGKTSTLRMMSEMKPNASGLYIAFNKSVADSAQKVFGMHVECRTSHSLAYRHVIRSSQKNLLDKLRTGPQRDDRQAITEDFNLMSRGFATTETRNSGPQSRFIGGWQLTALALDTLDRFCQTGSAEPSAAHVVPPRNFKPQNFNEFRKQAWEAIGPVVLALWDDLLDPSGKYMRFTHSSYLKLFQLSAPVLPYDFILLDEAQDTAPVTEDVVVRQAEHSLLVMVGDPSQAIYGFTGARDSMTRFADSGIPNVSLNLSESWRFGAEVSAAANSILSQTDREIRVTGRGGEGKVLSRTDERELPSVYVCRSNFNVIEAALEAIAAGFRVDTSSVDLRDVTAFLEGAIELKAGKRTRLGGLGAYKTWAEFAEDYEDGVPMNEGPRVGMMLLEKFGTESECLSKISLIQDSSVRGNKADVKVITIHKAKGGEWESVSVRDERAFVKRKDENETQWWELADANLSYVAVTRAQSVLDPGSLWPLTDYGLVCDPSILLSRVTVMVEHYDPVEKEKLRAANTDEAYADFFANNRRPIERLAREMGMRLPEGAGVGFVRLMKDLLGDGNA